MAAFILSSHHIPASTLATSTPSSRVSSPLPSHLPRSCQQPFMAAPSSRPRLHHPCPPPSCLRRQPHMSAFLASPVPHTRPPLSLISNSKRGQHPAALFLSSSAAIHGRLFVVVRSHVWLPSFSLCQQPSLAAFIQSSSAAIIGCLLLFPSAAVYGCLLTTIRPRCHDAAETWPLLVHHHHHCHHRLVVK